MNALLKAVVALPAFAGTPKSVSVDYEDRPATDSWLADHAGTADSNVSVHWSGSAALQLIPGEAVFFWQDMTADPEELMALFAELPIELAVVAPLHEEWTDDDDFEYYGFGDRHATHGFACAFTSAGRERLVSARWLEHGPWVVHTVGDVTLVQFHDADADAMTALAQADPGRLLLSREDGSGYLPPAYHFEHELAGVYEPERRVHKILINDRSVSELELRDACAMRRDKRNDPDTPIERVAYVFMQEELALKYRDALWLRDLECWAFVDGVETRLDEDYAPNATPPEWARG